MSLRDNITGTYDYRGLSALLAPVAWSGTVSADERIRQETDLDLLVSEARSAIDESGGRSVEIKNGQIVATVEPDDGDE